MNGKQWTHTDRVDELTWQAPAGSDLFISPATGKANCVAPVYYTEVEGDFVLRGKVTHPFLSTYDAGGFLIHQDDTHWAKVCYELTGEGTHAAITMVTNGVSDDCTGPCASGPWIWMQIARKGKVFGFYYSEDGKTFSLLRIFTIPADDKIRVGLVAQCPKGDGAEVQFADVGLYHISLSDLHNGSVELTK
ncbi:DUF1349 domain-containing protein [[Clostridium] leptum]|uniref:DUF1349 domain-containing protein n=1 Tax=Solibaculum mannosilyticum TaxID=2780922 RepID=A0A7I8D166_9FIRM|nr:DUF1349 domain-containing protein [Solibaculum mannosilyticum]MCO7137785.1 DUF1349 domain-containing protein [[Clostridium] leptum]BCI60530.1 hypothetical protein C12CBH8_11690 [Solibaculum mannosilyticum]